MIPSTRGIAANKTEVPEPLFPNKRFVFKCMSVAVRLLKFIGVAYSKLFQNTRCQRKFLKKYAMIFIFGGYKTLNFAETLFYGAF